ncbi:GH14152 [Drosophila grimshawi]|uniref:GH14152 n=1 Tax=Drosophila grimshawi TaxID=7222 RepID=B4JXU1_DROGR|nr:GH14152 [Drosophila grimshawi]
MGDKAAPGHADGERNRSKPPIRSVHVPCDLASSAVAFSLMRLTFVSGLLPDDSGCDMACSLVGIVLNALVCIRELNTFLFSQLIAHHEQI